MNFFYQYFVHDNANDKKLLGDSYRPWLINLIVLLLPLTRFIKHYKQLNGNNALGADGLSAFLLQSRLRLMNKDIVARLPIIFIKCRIY